MPLYTNLVEILFLTRLILCSRKYNLYTNLFQIGKFINLQFSGVGKLQISRKILYFRCQDHFFRKLEKLCCYFGIYKNYCHREWPQFPVDLASTPSLKHGNCLYQCTATKTKQRAGSWSQSPHLSIFYFKRAGFTTVICLE